MSFLPIVERELRVAARKSSLYRVRVLVAGATVLVGAAVLGIGFLSGGTSVGGRVFTVLLGLAFAYCLLEGLRAADAVSEEKREGTLGLLFLTDLRGYDVVLGKLISVAIRSFHGVLAFVPMLGIALILGGVTIGEFWRSALALVITLLVALAVALCVSTLSRQAHRAMGVSILLLLAQEILPSIVQNIQRSTGLGLPKLIVNSLVFVSPATALGTARDLAYRVSPEYFWGSVAGCFLLTCLALTIASFVISRTWTDRDAAPSLLPTFRALWQRWQHGNPEKRASRRGRLLDRNPFLWLASRNPRDRLNLGFSFGVACAVGIIAGVAGDMSAAWISGMLLSVVLKAWICWRAVQVFSDARRHGAMELFLVTPRGTEEMIRGSMIAVREVFLWPVLFVMILLAVPSRGLFGPNPVEELWRAGLATYGVLTLFTGALASGWVGLWFGLSQRKIVPSFLIALLVSMIAPAMAFCVPNLVIHFVLIWWFRGQLHRRFRILGLGELNQAGRLKPRQASVPNPEPPPMFFS
ncbi:MAG: hypothetical protein EXS31_03700 [Pedosphaera sp.]|nr:hypothetical protein [Pedosphaera sp.]